MISSIFTNSTYTVSNSAISNIEKIKDGVALNMVFDFEYDRKVIERCIKEALKVVDDIPGTTNVAYFGVTNINDKGVTYGFGFSASLMKQFEAKTAFYEKVFDLLTKEGIKPFTTDFEVRMKDND